MYRWIRLGFLDEELFSLKAVDLAVFVHVLETSERPLPPGAEQACGIRQEGELLCDADCGVSRFRGRSPGSTVNLS